MTSTADDAVEDQPTPYTPTVSEVERSAAAVIEEARRHIGLQNGDAASIDTKSSALLAASVAVLGSAASRVHIDSDQRAATGALALGVAVLLLLCCRQALRPRDGFSYGADPTTLASIAADYAPYGVLRRASPRVTQVGRRRHSPVRVSGR